MIKNEHNCLLNATFGWNIASTGETGGGVRRFAKNIWVLALIFGKCGLTSRRLVCGWLVNYQRPLASPLLAARALNRPENGFGVALLICSARYSRI